MGTQGEITAGIQALSGWGGMNVCRILVKRKEALF
jgi:hypothetical protein